MKRRVLAPLVVASLLGLAVAAHAAVEAGAEVFFWSDRGRPTLFTMQSDGKDARLVYRTLENAKRPTASPDGRWIAFDGASPGKPPMTDFDVQIVRRDGTGRRTLAGTPAFELDASWSPDGRLVSYSRQQAGDWKRSWIWVVRRDGGGAHRLARGQFARWSPDGSRLVLDAPTARSDGDLFVVSSAGRVLKRLTSTPELEQPAGWSPDGRSVLFTRFRLDGRGANIFIVSSDGSGQRRLTRGTTEDVAADWSPDGRRILFTSNRTGREQVYVMKADGTGQRNISRSRFDDVATSWR